MATSLKNLRPAPRPRPPVRRWWTPLLIPVRLVRLAFFIAAGLCIMLDGTVFWPFFILAVLFLPKTLGKLLTVNIWAKPFSFDDLLAALYVSAHLALVIWLWRADRLEWLFNAAGVFSLGGCC